jgi:archaellum biogenesis ATPase FlaH
MKSTEHTNNEQELRELMGEAAATSIGYEPSWKERRAEEKKLKAEQARIFEEYRERRAAEAAIEVRTVSDWASFNAECTMQNAQSSEAGQCIDEDCRMHGLRSAEPGELFPPFWHPGELAVLMGPSGVGKSRLAMRIAQQVNSEQRIVNSDGTDPESEEFLKQRREGCKETNHPVIPTDRDATPPYPSRGAGVLYIDLERTERLYRERYSGVDGGVANVDLGLLADAPTPEKYRGKRHKFLLAAVNERLRDGHRVVIVDNLTWLLKGESWEIRLLLKGFRRWVNETGNSMLLLWHSSPVQSLELQAARFDLADTIFAMKTSTMGENIRYIKSLKSPRKASSWKPFAQAPLFEMQSDVMLMRRNEIGGFDAIGPSPEIAHHHDYAAEILEAKYALSRGNALLPAERPLEPKRVKFLEIN